MIKQLPKNMTYSFNEKDKNFAQNYKNRHTKIPDILALTYHISFFNIQNQKYF